MAQATKTGGHKPDSNPEPVNPPAGKKAPAKKVKPVLEVGNRYTSKTLDPEITDLDEYDTIRQDSVDSSMAFLNTLTEDLEGLVENVYVWMRNPSKNPHKGVHVPRNMSEASLTEIMDMLARAQAAYQQFAEVRSVLAAVEYQRASMLERRKHQALINHGNNDAERKGLSSMRSDPEMLQHTKIKMALTWCEPRFYAYGKMVDSLQQLITTKSVEMSREGKDADSEYRGH